LRIAIFGLGYVGVTAAACLSSQGHQVFGVDVNADKVAAINAGRSPILEPSVEEMLKEANARGSLRATSNTAQALQDSDVALICVGTPSAPDGAHNMGFIAEVTRQIAESLPDHKLTVVYRSTVRPGTMENLIAPLFRRVAGDASAAVELVYNPEFLREASAVADYFAPPKIVVGTADGRPSAAMQQLYAGIQAPWFTVGFKEAEFTKFADNTWHAVKVAYANELGRICSRLGVKASTVHEIFVADEKLNLSKYYLRPGGPFGGSCLPKDVRALQHIAADVGANTHLIDSLLASNQAHKHQIFDAIRREYPPPARVLLIGLTFKAGTDDLRESPALDLARMLLEAGYSLEAFDQSLDSAALVGQNLGYAYTHLPELSDLLVSEAMISETEYDLVIASNDSWRDVALRHNPPIVRTYVME